MVAVVAEAFSVRFRGVRISGGFAALVVAMALLGPVPAAAIGGREVVFENLIAKRCWTRAGLECDHVRRDPFFGGWMLALVGREDPIAFAACVVLVFLVTNALAFTFGRDLPAPEGRP